MKLTKIADRKWSVENKGVTVTFQEGSYNETSEVVVIESLKSDIGKCFKLSNEIADWIFQNHYELAFPFEDSLGKVIGRSVKEKADKLGVNNTILQQENIVTPFTMRKILKGEKVETSTLFRVLNYLDLTLQVKNKGE